jgi:[protein-PII] uridylyltransferase
MILATTPAFEPLRCVSTLPDVHQNVARAGSTARVFVQAAREELRQRHDGGAGGLAVVAAYTDAIDHLVQWLFDNATVHYQAKNPRLNQRCTLVAQGGYGRGELNIQSDIDLLFLYPWKVNPYAETIAEIVIPGLYDAGLVVGAAMRNVRECCRLAARDLKVKTALLDARYLCGDRSPYDDFAALVVEEVWTPNRVGSFRDLVALGVLTDRDVDDMDAALDFLWRVRNAMHFTTGTHQDHLTFDLEDRLATALGFGPGRPGIEAFMRRYYTDATTVHRLGETVIAR